MAKRREQYERMGERAARGEYELVDPLDFLLLAELPEEGDLVMGFYPNTMQVETLRKGKFSALTSEQLSARFSSMRVQGMVVNVRVGGSKTRGWQRTARGKAVYEGWRAAQQLSQAQEMEEPS